MLFKKLNYNILADFDKNIQEKTDLKSIIYDTNGASAKTEIKVLNVPSLDIIPSEINKPVYNKIKRIFDILFSIIVLTLFAPLWLLVFITIKIETAGSAVYKHRRVGKNGKEFNLYKFRSMVDDAEKYTGPVWAIENDMRITKIGRIIRKFGIDEIPQLINVLKGDMSIIGPRPERPFFVEKFNKIIPFYTQRTKTLPGITGLAQVKHKYDSNLEDVIKKLEFDLNYLDSFSFKLDLYIIFNTIYVLITCKGKF